MYATKTVSGISNLKDVRTEYTTGLCGGNNSMGSPNDAAEPGPAEPPTADSDTFCLRWKNHSQHLLDVFGQLYQDEALVDVTLAAEGRSLRAHKMVLSACSPFFRDIFAAHPESHPIVILKDTPYSELQTLLDFMYKGEVSIDQDNLDNLLKTADDLCIRGLADVVGQWREKAIALSVPVQTVENKESDIKSESASTTPNDLSSVPNEQRDYLAYYPRHKHAKRKRDSGDSREDFYENPEEHVMRAASAEPEEEEQPPHNDIKMEASPSLDREEAQDLSRPSVSQSSSPPSVNVYHGGVIAAVHKFHWPTVSDSEESEGELEETGASGISYSQPPYDGIVKLSSDQTGPGIPSFTLVTSLSSLPTIKSEHTVIKRSNSARLHSPASDTEPALNLTCGRSRHNSGSHRSGRPPDDFDPGQILEQKVSMQQALDAASIGRPMFHIPLSSSMAIDNHFSAITNHSVIASLMNDATHLTVPADLSLASTMFPRVSHGLQEGVSGVNLPSLGRMPMMGRHILNPQHRFNLPGLSLSDASVGQQAGRGNFGPPPTLCKYCGKSFTEMSALLAHLPFHTGDRPFRCDFCGKAFKLRHHMKDHARVHTGERPFSCRTCGKTFSRSTILKAHEKTHLPKADRVLPQEPSHFPP